MTPVSLDSPSPSTPPDITSPSSDDGSLHSDWSQSTQSISALGRLTPDRSRGVSYFPVHTTHLSPRTASATPDPTESMSSFSPWSDDEQWDSARNAMREFISSATAPPVASPLVPDAVADPPAAPLSNSRLGALLTALGVKPEGNPMSPLSTEPIPGGQVKEKAEGKKRKSDEEHRGKGGWGNYGWSQNKDEPNSTINTPVFPAVPTAGPGSLPPSFGFRPLSLRPAKLSAKSMPAKSVAQVIPATQSIAPPIFHPLPPFRTTLEDVYHQIIALSNQISYSNPDSPDTSPSADPTELQRLHEQNAKLSTLLNHERTSHLKTISELRVATNKKSIESGIDIEVVENIATELITSSMDGAEAGAALLDEVDRARKWNKVSMPGVAGTGVALGEGRADPMTRLRDVEGVVDVTLNRVEDLERVVREKVIKVT